MSVLITINAVGCQMGSSDVHRLKQAKPCVAATVDMLAPRITHAACMYHILHALSASAYLRLQTDIHSIIVSICGVHALSCICIFAYKDKHPFHY